MSITNARHAPSLRADSYWEKQKTVLEASLNFERLSANLNMQLSGEFLSRIARRKDQDDLRRRKKPSLMYYQRSKRTSDQGRSTLRALSVAFHYMNAMTSDIQKAPPGICYTLTTYCWSAN